MHKSSCHCGAVEIEIYQLPARLVACNCSICRRYASLWGHLTQETAKVSYEPGAASFYKWGDGAIEFYHCNSCGCVTHYELIDKDSEARLSVNFQMFPQDLVDTLETKRFDGADSWKFLD